MINFTSKPRYALDDLIRLVHALRAPGGCPWDAAQTHLSIRRNFLEEAYEACEALDCDDAAMLREELGDVLLQVLFHADIEADRGRMTIDDIADAECRKLIFRHPFLFGGENASWDELKKQEKGQKTTGEAMQGVARSLPATWRAEKIQKKAAKTGFCWKSAGQALDKLAEEAQELREAVQDDTNIDEELGDLLFAAVRVASTLDKDPEQALHSACEKFIKRFTAMEQSILASGRTLEELSREERTMVFHEAPHKLRPTLADMLEVLGDRPVALCRELTKLHEETVRTTLAQAVELYQEKEPRGEYVLVVAGAEKAAAPAVTLDQGVRQVLRLRQEGVRMKDAVRQVAEDTGLPRNDLYNAALAEME